MAVICPWNLPLLLMTWKVGPALACGNTVVVKPSEETPQTATLLGEVMNTVGVPKGVYNVVHGFGPNSAGEFLTTHPGVNAITFTGETRSGAAIMKAAADGARPVSMEMGGKNPAIVFADCEFDAAIEGTMRSVFANCGQVCLGTERVYVERPIFERFVEAMKRGAEKLQLGPPEDPATGMGPLISLFDREEEVIRRANDTRYGLAASVWTSNLQRAHRVARNIEAGLIWVNSWFLRDLRTPLGGAKQSGIGREGGVHSIEFHTELRNVCVKR